MATNLAVNDVYVMRNACRTATQVGINVTHWLVTLVGATPATDADFADFADNLLAPKYKNAMPATASFWGTQVSRIQPAPPTFPVSLSARNGPGLFAGDLLPEQVSGIGTYLTASAGRGFRGRSYVPFPGKNAVNSPADQPTAAYVAILDQIIQELATPFGVVAGPRTATLVPVIFHRKTSTYTLVQGHLTRPYWATQRRRGDAGRPNLNPPW